MPQNRHVKNWKTMLSGAKIAAGETVTPEPEWTPEMQAAYERRRGPNYGKDINLPRSRSLADLAKLAPVKTAKR